MKTKDITQISLFTVLIVVCSWLSIALGPVQFTMQTFAIFTALNFLGGKKGTISIATYIMLGAIGLPVFSNFGSLGSLLGPTGGYIVGFLLQGVIYIIIEKFFGDKLFVKTLNCIIGQIACYTVGTFWFMFIKSGQGSHYSFFAALFLCVIPFIVPDLCKLVLSLIISLRLKKIERSQLALK